LAISNHILQQKSLVGAQFKNKKIQVIGLPRSGSSYFADAINKITIASTLGSTVILGEPIQDGNVKEINYYYAAIKDPNVVVIKHHARQFDSLVKHYGYERLSKRFYNIGLIRNNIFSLALSLSVVKHTGQAADYTYTVNDKLTIDRETFISCLHTQISAWEAFVSCKDHYNEIVYYRDLTFDPAVDFNNLKLALNLFPTDIELMENKKEYLAPNKFEVVTNHEELHQVTLDFLAYYTHPQIEVTGVNFELRPPNSKTTANRISQGIDNYRSY
jgi:hypothetical protein